MSDFILSGISGVDQLLAGKGIPKGHTVLVSGGPGSGKTTFGIQFLHEGATKYDEPGLYVTLDEDPEDIKKNMAAFGWDLGALEEEIKLIFVNVSPVRVVPTDRAGLVQLGMQEFKLVKLLEAIKKDVEDIGAKRLVVDPVTMFMLQYPDETERIHAMRDLITELRKTDCTHLLISELRGTGIEREYQFEEYLSQGVILLRTIQKGDQLIRMIQVEKMRGVDADAQPRPYEISEHGIEVYPTLMVFDLRIEFRQKVGQNPCRELPLGRNLKRDQTRDYPRER
jgi:KaiC/GvpD/RAD55 family RecA-like ATPase